VYTFVETPTFAREADKIWTEEARAQFFEWLSSDPAGGEVIPGSGGCRKVRWSGGGRGKRGGVRVIYYMRHRSTEIWLLLVYRKAVRDSIPAHLIKAIREEIEGE
jgi:mRNA-degrading endonuclease RelE of RelBE toxin-antitoxin system